MGSSPKFNSKSILAPELINRGFLSQFQGFSIQHSPSVRRARTTKNLQLPSKKDQALEVSETYWKPAEFRSSACNEPPVTKQKGSNLTSFRNRFRNCRIQKFRLQGVSSYQAERIKPCKFQEQIQNLQNSEIRITMSIQLSSRKDQTL